MAIMLMALLFMLEERVRHGVTVPMLSTADIEKLLNTTCHAVTPTSKGSSGCCRRVTTGNNEQLRHIASDLRRSDKVE
jgi:hypothetical protein